MIETKSNDKVEVEIKPRPYMGPRSRRNSPSCHPCGKTLSDERPAIAPTDTDSPLPMHALGMKRQRYLVIPKWFVSFPQLHGLRDLCGSDPWGLADVIRHGRHQGRGSAQNELRGSELETSAADWLA